MARVTVNERAHSDVRLTAAARALRMSRERLGWRLIHVWSAVTEQQSSVLETELVAAALGRRAEPVADALCGAGLAEPVGDSGSLDLEPLAELFGDFSWYGEFQDRERAERGGRRRAAQAARDPDTGKFLRRDLEAEVLAALADGQPRSRARLRLELRARHSLVARACARLLERGMLVRSGDNELTIASPADNAADTADTAADMVTETAEQPHGQPGAPSAPALAPALAPVARQAGDSARAQPDAGEPPGGPCAPYGEGRGSAGDTGRGALGTATSGDARCTRLYEYWDGRGRAAFGDAWRSPGPVAGPHRVAQALQHPELMGRTDEEIQHAVDMLHAEALERAQHGDAGAGQWYQRAWSPGVMAVAIDTPNAAAARARARPRRAPSRSAPLGSVTPAPREVFLAAKARDEVPR